MQTDITNARETILRYLTGKHIDPATLENAYELLKCGSPGSLGELRQAMGIVPDIPADCLLCRNNMAELCSMSPRERASEMPEMVVHVRTCEDCRSRFRMARELWRDISSTAAGSVRELSNTVRIVVENGRQWLQIDADTELAFGTLATARGVAMGVPGEGTVRQEWRAEDDETGYSFLFTAFISPGSGHVALQCEVIDPNGDFVTPGDVHIDVYDQKSDSRLVAGTLDDFDEDLLELPPGEWSLLFSCGTVEEPREWRISLCVSEESNNVSSG